MCVVTMASGLVLVEILDDWYELCSATCDPLHMTEDRLTEWRRRCTVVAAAFKTYTFAPVQLGHRRASLRHKLAGLMHM